MVNVSHFVGTPFVNGGRNKTSGLDCWGLVMEVFKECGIQLPDFRVNAFASSKIDELAHEAIGFSPWEEVYSPQDEDAPLVVLMRIHPSLIAHAGAYIGNNRIIHTMEGTNAVISRVSRLKSRIVGYYRYVQNN